MRRKASGGGHPAHTTRPGRGDPRPSAGRGSRQRRRGVTRVRADDGPPPPAHPPTSHQRRTYPRSPASPRYHPTAPATGPSPGRPPPDATLPPSNDDERRTSQQGGRHKAAPWSPPAPADSTTAPPDHATSGQATTLSQGQDRPKRGGRRVWPGTRRPPNPSPPNRRHRPADAPTTRRSSPAKVRPCPATDGPEKLLRRRGSQSQQWPAGCGCQCCTRSRVCPARPAPTLPFPGGRPPPRARRDARTPGQLSGKSSSSPKSRGWPSPAGPEKSLNGSGREGSDPAPPVDAPGPPVSKMVDPVSPNSEAEDTFTWGGRGGGASNGRGPTTSDEAVGACNICRSSPRCPGVSRDRYH